MYKISCMVLLGLLVVLALASSDVAETIPGFARKYSLSCSDCHIAVPKLKDYGDEFAGNGFQLPDEEEPVRAYQDVGDDILTLQRDLPIAIRLDTFARFMPDNDDVDNDLQSPFGLKLMSGGTIARDIGYYFYFYMDERGEVAGMEDAYVHFNNIGGTEFDIMVGQFQISDPLFKRELRLTYEDYIIYTTTIGQSNTTLKYDRGVMMTYSLPTQTDLVVEVVNGNGIEDAGGDHLFDNNSFKNVFGKVTQSFPLGSVGVFAYSGKGVNDDFPGIENEFLMWGPDISVGTDMIEVNAQYLRREDDNPDFAVVKPDAIITEGFIGEVVVNPMPETSRLFGVLLYNSVTSDLPGTEYETVTANVSYLLRRNMRFMVEYTRDIEQEANMVTVGYMAGF